MKEEPGNKIERVRQLFERYGGIIYAKCLRILREPSDAEDAVQETFINAFRALDSLYYGSSALPWLYRIATNVCLKMLRSARRRGVPANADIETVASATPGAARKLDARALLEDLLDQLDERDLQIIIAHHLDGMDQSQVAEMIGISRRAVVRRLTAIRKRLGNLMEADSDG